MKNRKGMPYCVSFDTLEMPGRVMGIRVELSKLLIDNTDHVRIDLADHPLYHHVWEYCRNNPPGKKK